MIIKEAVYEKCKRCGAHRRMSNEEYGCDKCHAPISYGDNDDSVGCLNATIHYKDERSSKEFHFCSWDCCLSHMQSIQNSPDASDYFISFPFLHCDEGDRRLNFDGFWDAVRRLSGSRKRIQKATRKQGGAV